MQNTPANTKYGKLKTHGKSCGSAIVYGIFPWLYQGFPSNFHRFSIVLFLISGFLPCQRFSFGFAFFTYSFLQQAWFLNSLSCLDAFHITRVNATNVQLFLFFDPTMCFVCWFERAQGAGRLDIAKYTSVIHVYLNTCGIDSYGWHSLFYVLCTAYSSHFSSLCIISFKMSWSRARVWQDCARKLT